MIIMIIAIILVTIIVMKHFHTVTSVILCEILLILPGRGDSRILFIVRERTNFFGFSGPVNWEQLHGLTLDQLLDTSHTIHIQLTQTGS